MEQKQSYLSTVVKGDMNLYEVRIFMLIVEQAYALAKVLRLHGHSSSVISPHLPRVRPRKGSPATHSQGSSLKCNS